MSLRPADGREVLDVRNVRDVRDACDVRDAIDAPRWHEEADVVVVGLEAAGASAAIEAAAAGADVLVLECASGGGGTSATSHGQLYLGGGTVWREEKEPVKVRIRVDADLVPEPQEELSPEAEIAEG